MTDEEETNKKLFIFGRDITQIPCFRNSFLYGISGGLAVSVIAFMATSRPGLATHIGFGSFVCGTLGYWCVCRYQWSKTRFEYQRLKAGMQNKALYEGTATEEEMMKENILKEEMI